MINFIICDDDIKFTEFVNQVITKYMMKNKLEYKIHKFYDYNKEFIKKVEEKIPNKIYILDIETPTKSGIDIARIIRNKDINSVLIFLTGHQELGQTVMKNDFLFLSFINKFDDCENRLVKAIERAENRDSFEKVMESLELLQPKGKAVTNIEAGIKAAEEIGYPVLVRPSYVLGGRAMQIVSNKDALVKYLTDAVSINHRNPVLVDKYIMGRELEVDAVCDGKDVFIPGIMEHVEKTGIHSGDSISVYPTFDIEQSVKDTIIDYTVKLGLGIGIIGLYNIQFIVDKNNDVYVIEVNPRSSRTVPFISKSTGYSLADIAAATGGNGYGNDGFFGGSGWWIILLFLIEFFIFS